MDGRAEVSLDLCTCMITHLLAYIERVRACTKHSVPIQIEVSDDDDDVPELASGTTAPKKTTLLAPRRGEPLASCRQVLTQWRAKTWLAEYSMCAFDKTALLEDKDLTVLASRAQIQNLSDLKFNVPNWSFASKYGQEVLAILREVDDRYQAARDLEAAEREAKRLRRLHAEPIHHPWEIPANRPFGHFWSYSLRMWLPIPVEVEHLYY